MHQAKTDENQPFLRATQKHSNASLSSWLSCSMKIVTVHHLRNNIFTPEDAKQTDWERDFANAAQMHSSVSLSCFMKNVNIHLRIHILA